MEARLSRKDKFSVLTNASELFEPPKYEDEEEDCFYNPYAKQRELERKFNMQTVALCVVVMRRWAKLQMLRKKILNTKKDHQRKKEENAAVCCQRAFRNKLKIRLATKEYMKLKEKNKKVDLKIKKIKEQKEIEKQELEDKQAEIEKATQREKIENKAATIIQRTWKKRKARFLSRQRVTMAKSVPSNGPALQTSPAKLLPKTSPPPPKQNVKFVPKNRRTGVQLKPITNPQK
jgi:hypothetical protein